MIITDRSGHIEYVNDGFERMTGYKSDEVIGRKPGSFLQGPETDPETIKSVSERLKAAEPFYHEVLNYTKEGEPYWISLSITPIFNENNECERFVSIQANITQTKLKAIGYTKCIENIEKTNISLSWDNELILASANEAAFAVNNYKSLDDIITSRDFNLKTLLSDGELHAMYAGDTLQKSINIKTQKGNIVLSATFFPLLSMNGDLRKVIMYGIDLSERSNAISDMFHNVLSQINSVASDILDVSSQTNMLSLNASVEAARAGENGKSFAVVASEVKELAFKASDLSNEIAELVVDTQTRIDQLKTIDDKKSA